MLYLLVAACATIPSFEDFYRFHTGIPYPAMQYEQMSTVNARIANEFAEYANLVRRCALEDK